MTITRTMATQDSGQSRGAQIVGRLATLLAVPVVLIATWWLIALVLDSSVIVGPIDAFAQIVDTVSSSRYQASLVVTIQTIAIGFVFAVVLGGVAGFALGLSPFWFRAMSPIVQGVYSIPKVTIFPLFLVFLGLGIASRSSFAFIHGFFPMVIIVMGATAGVRATPIYLKIAASLEMSFAQLLRTILLPAILPSFLTAARIAFGLVFLGAILAEMFAANGGLGHELVRNMHLVRIDRILAQVMLIGVLAILPNALLRTLEVKLTRRVSSSR